jgi:hypothetical protein
MTRLPFEQHLLSGKLRGRRGWLRYFQRHEIGAVCQEAVVKNGGGFGTLPALDAGAKINFQPVKQVRAKTAMKTWAIVVGVLIVLFCLSYLVQHPATVDQTFAKVFAHNGADTTP